MKAGKLFITEERIKRLETAIESLLCQIDKDLYSLIPVKALASIDYCVSCRSNYFVAKKAKIDNPSNV